MLCALPLIQENNYRTTTVWRNLDGFGRKLIGIGTGQRGLAVALQAPPAELMRVPRPGDGFPVSADPVPSSTNQPIFEKYKRVSFPIFADYLGEVPLKSVKFPNFAD